MFSTPSELVAYLADHDVKFVDVRFCDLPGVMQHFNLPASAYGEDEIRDGLLFDGSSVRGFQSVNELSLIHI